MEETPLEQLVVELATKWTGEESVPLLAGEETDTPANEHAESVSKQTRIFIVTPATLGGAEQIGRWKGKATAHGQAEFRDTLAGVQLTFNQHS